MAPMNSLKNNRINLLEQLTVLIQMQIAQEGRYLISWRNKIHKIILFSIPGQSL